MIEQNIADHIKSDTVTLSEGRQNAKNKLRHLVGTKLYLCRLPEEAIPLGVSIRRISGGELYELGGEYTICQPLIEFTVLGRDHEHGTKVLDVADSLRLLFSGYRGSLGANHCYGCTLERSASLVPSRIGDGSDRWVHMFSMDFRFTVDQVVT